MTDNSIHIFYILFIIEEIEREKDGGKKREKNRRNIS
jgi:hypothetical protein